MGLAAEEARAIVKNCGLQWRLMTFAACHTGLAVKWSANLDGTFYLWHAACPLFWINAAVALVTGCHLSYQLGAFFGH